MDVADIVVRVKRTFGDEGGIQVTDADIFRWITDAQREAVLQDDNLLQVEATGNLSPGVNELATPAGLLNLAALYVNNTKITYYSVQQLDQQGIKWRENGTVSGTPVAWTRVGSNLYLYPAPSTAYSYRILYSKEPGVIAAASDTIGLPAYYFNYLVDYCLMKAYEMDEDWEATAAKAGIVQATLNANAMRTNYFGSDYFPLVTEID